MLMTTTGLTAGMTPLGTVFAVCVMAGNIVKDTRENLRNLIGGEMRAYGGVIEQAVSTAFDRLQEKAAALGADAVVSIRIASADVTAGGAEIIVYGTAVRIEKQYTPL
jgi:uncharacterized protein YbjQ (UPF0145 family)